MWDRRAWPACTRAPDDANDDTTRNEEQTRAPWLLSRSEAKRNEATWTHVVQQRPSPSVFSWFVFHGQQFHTPFVLSFNSASRSPSIRDPRHPVDPESSPARPIVAYGTGGRSLRVQDVISSVLGMSGRVAAPAETGAAELSRAPLSTRREWWHACVCVTSSCCASCWTRGIICGQATTTIGTFTPHAMPSVALYTMGSWTATPYRPPRECQGQVFLTDATSWWKHHAKLHRKPRYVHSHPTAFVYMHLRWPFCTKLY